MKIDSNFLKKIPSLLIINLLWILFSLPVITIGASTCAAFYVSMKLTNNEEIQPAKMFIKAFKEDFIQGVLMGIITGASIYLICRLWKYAANADDYQIVLLLASIVVTAIGILINLYAFPMIARYTNSLKNIIRNAAVLCVQFFKSTGSLIVQLILIAIVVSLVRYFTSSTRLVTDIILILFLPELIIYTISLTAKPIFQDIENRPEPSTEEETEDSTDVDDEETTNSDE